MFELAELSLRTASLPLLSTTSSALARRFATDDIRLRDGFVHCLPPRHSCRTLS